MGLHAKPFGKEKGMHVKVQAEAVAIKKAAVLSEKKAKKETENE